MIGNDIIDLALAKKESNWKRKGYLNKIFTPKEQVLILNAPDPDSMLWNLWSRKEAAYKIYNRETGIRGYFPVQLKCDYENQYLGKVSCNGKVYFTKTTITADQIHTIATTKLEYFNQIFFLKNRESVLKNNGIPYLLNPLNNKHIPVSISHHGKYEAFIKLML